MEFAYIPPGMGPELDALNLDEVCRHAAVYCNNFLLDEIICRHYCTRLANDDGVAEHKNALQWLRYMVKKMLHYRPFNEQALNVALALEAEENAKKKLQATCHLAARIKRDQSLHEEVVTRIKFQDPIYARKTLEEMLRSSPSNLHVAIDLLELDIKLGLDPGQWLACVSCPPLLQQDWRRVVLIYAARFGLQELARSVLGDWEGDTEAASNETFLVHKGLLYLRQGRKELALEAFQAALELDTLLRPVQHMAGELEKPFVVRPDALEGTQVIIGIYSHNKAEMLHMTLQSLAQSSIGRARLLILLNGCNDGSADAARAAAELIPENEVRLIELPVNMGAPQARNLLLHEAHKSGFDFMAFLDDDVVLPPNWLQALLSEAREQPQAGVFGCKVVGPPPLHLLQYLHKNVAVARENLIRLSMPGPGILQDTGLYDVRRDTDMVMGCCHLIRRECFDHVPGFDICFSPSQLDDVAFHLDVRLAGYTIRYVGQVQCCHHRSTGSTQSTSLDSKGNWMGNDVKFHYRFVDRLASLQQMQRLRIQETLAGQDTLQAP